MTGREWLSSLFESLKSFLSVVFDLFILNILFFLCCVPIVTAGAGAVACYANIFRMLRKGEQGMPVRTFFKDFKAAFKTATPPWLLLLLCIFILAVDLWFALYVSQPVNKFFLISAIVTSVIVMGGAAWLFPLMARYENSAKEHIKNAFLMAFANLPRTLLAVLIQAVSILLPLLFPPMFYLLGWLWILLGFSGTMYLCALTMRKPLKCMPEKADDGKREPRED